MTIETVFHSVLEVALYVSTPAVNRRPAEG
jgi:hypothetical protein